MGSVQVSELVTWILLETPSVVDKAHKLPSEFSWFNTAHFILYCLKKVFCIDFVH